MIYKKLNLKTVSFIVTFMILCLQVNAIALAAQQEDRIFKKIKTLKENEQTCQFEINTLKGDIKRIETSLAEIAQQGPDISKSISEKEVELVQAEGLLKELQLEQKDLSKMRKEFVSEKKEANSLRPQVENYVRKKKALQELLSDKQESIKELQALLKETFNKIDELEKEKAKLTLQEEMQEELDPEMFRLQREMMVLQGELSKVEQQKKQERAKIYKIKSDLAFFQNALGQIDEGFNQLQKEQAKLVGLEHTASIAQKQKQMSEEANRLESQIKIYTKNCTVAYEDLTTAQNILKDLEGKSEGLVKGLKQKVAGFIEKEDKISEDKKETIAKKCKGIDNKIANFENKKLSTDKRINKLKVEITEHKEEILTLEREITSIGQKGVFEKLDSQIKKIKRQEEATAKSINDTIEKRELLKKDLSQLKQLLSQISKNGEEKKKQLSKNIPKLSKMEQKYKQLCSKIERLKTELATIDTAKSKEFSSLEAKLRESSEVISILGKQKDLLETKIEKLTKRTASVSGVSIKALSAQPSSEVKETTTGYTILPNDVLEITVYGAPDLTTTVRVADDGSISYPLLGRVKVINLTPAQLEEILAQKLSEGYIVNPQVSVFVQKFAKITMLGEINIAGTLELEEQMTILDAIAKAGGFTDAADVDAIRIIRVVDGKPAAINIRITEITKKGDRSKNIRLLPQDIVYMPKLPEINVLGEVGIPGTFSLKGQMTILDAIAKAGGFTDMANIDTTKIIRVIDGKETSIKVKVTGISKNGDDKAENICLLPGDTIHVSKFDKITVLGEVEAPGVFDLKENMTALDAIALAGGFTDEAAPNRTKIIRGRGKGKKYIRAKLHDVLTKGDRTKDALLEPDDILSVPESFF